MAELQSSSRESCEKQSARSKLAMNRSDVLQLEVARYAGAPVPIVPDEYSPSGAERSDRVGFSVFAASNPSSNAMSRRGAARERFSSECTPESTLRVELRWDATEI